MSESSDFEQTKINKVRQVAKRGHYDKDTVNQILDSNLLANVGFLTDEGPVIIPMLFARRDDELLFHGSSKSRLMQMLCSGSPICVSTTLLDGLVLAKSLFHHSMNYRSVTVFGSGFEIVDEAGRMEALRIITDKVMKGRWDDARQPNDQEMKATCVAAIKINSASAKIRNGDPVDDDADRELKTWSGVIPLQQVASAPIRSTEEKLDVPCPQYVTDWIAQSKAEATTNFSRSNDATKESEVQSIIGPIDAYQPRCTEMIGVREIGGWKLKVYTISVNVDLIADDVIEAALEYARCNVLWPNRTAGFGFVTIHFGEQIWLLVDLWVDDILRHFVFRSQYTAPTNFTNAPSDGTTACVWELEVTRHERDAWVKHVLSTPSNPAFDAYLGESIQIAGPAN